MKREQVTIFCDGSCYWKLRKGGSGVYIQWNDNEYFIQQGYENTTISRCELRAILLALNALNNKKPLIVIIWSDSQYVVNGMKSIVDIASKNFEGIENQDLWRKVYDELKRLEKRVRVRINWTPGHGKDMNDPIVYGNAVADALADYKNFEYYKLDKIEEL
jgi:ribonuclease HI